MTRDRAFLPALRFDALTRFYDPVIAATTRERTFKRLLVGLAAPQPGEHVLDVGCGTGTLALEIARRAPGAAVAGVDADDAMLQRAGDKARRDGVEIDLRTAMAQDLPFEDASFDVAVSSLFFHHLRTPDKVAVAAEVLRVLRPGGRLVIADWGAPRDPVMRVAAMGIRLLDGAESTADNLRGLLPDRLRDAGFAEVQERDAMRTPFGVIALLTARRPGAAAGRRAG